MPPKILSIWARRSPGLLSSRMKNLNFVSSFCSVLLLASCSGCVVVQNVSVETAQSDFVAGKYESALGGLSRGEGYAKPKPEMAAQIGLLKGLCYQGLEKSAEARASFQSVASDYPKTDCGFMAKELLDCQPLNLGPPWVPSAT